LIEEMAMQQINRRPQTILVHMNREPVDALGEIFMRLPYLRALREWAPDSHITIIPGFGGANFWEDLLAPIVSPLVDEILRDRIPDPSERRFDWVFDMEGDAKTSFHLRSLARRKFLTTAWRGLLNLPHLPIYHGKHVAHRYLGVLRQAVKMKIQPAWPWPLPEAYRSAASALLPPGRDYIGIAPGAGRQTSGKCWPIDRYVALARHQSELGRVPVILLASHENGWEPHFDGIPGVILPLQGNEAASSGVPSDPVLTAAIAERLSVAVANCSGTGHMLALGGAAMVSLFGPTKPEKFAPLARSSVWLRPEDGGKDISAISLSSVLDAVEKQFAPPLSI